MIENVLRLEAKLEVTGALRGQRKLFQQRGVGKEAAGIPHVREDKRCVAEAEIRRPRECAAIQHESGILVDEVSRRIDQRAVVVPGLHHFHTGHERFAKSRARSGLTSWDDWNEQRSALGIPGGHTRDVPTAYDLIENLEAQCVAVTHELAAVSKRKLVGVIMSSAHLNHIYEWFGTTRAIVKLATT